jgi:hypothetical protein
MTASAAENASEACSVGVVGIVVMRAFFIRRAVRRPEIFLCSATVLTFSDFGYALSASSSNSVEYAVLANSLQNH